MTKLKYLAIATMVLAGCTQDFDASGGAGAALSDDSTDPAPDPAGAPDGRPVAQHQDCSQGGSCLEGLTCLSRVGPLEQQVSTCEIPCITQGCPGGQACVSLVEGPWKVCWQLDRGLLGASDCSLPGQGEPCPDRACSESLTCIAYHGIAGPAGGVFTSCEIPCGGGRPCQGDQQCITIADGPGTVCRPAERG